MQKRLLGQQRNQIYNQRILFFLGEGGGGGESDLENCAYLWKNPGYTPELWREQNLNNNVLDKWWSLPTIWQVFNISFSLMKDFILLYIIFSKIRLRLDNKDIGR